MTDIFTRYWPKIVPYEAPQKFLSCVEVSKRLSPNSVDLHKGIFALQGTSDEVYIADNGTGTHVLQFVAHGLRTQRELSSIQSLGFLLLVN